MTPLQRAARALCSFDRKWEALDQDGQRTYVERARAVLEAIREPSEGMIRAGVPHMPNGASDPSGSAAELQAAYGAMISALEHGGEV